AVERTAGDRRVEQRDEVMPQQERVVRVVGEAGDHVGAVDDQRVDAVVRRAVVAHVDQRAALAGQVHRIDVRIAFAVQVQHRRYPVCVGPVEQRVEQVVVGGGRGGVLEVPIEVVFVRGGVHVRVHRRLV